MTSARPARGEGEVVLPARDQEESVFAEILADLIQRVPGARAAALVDNAGETVDYAGRAAPFYARVAAAHWRIVLDTVRAQPSLEAVRSLVIRARGASFVVHGLPDGYALVVLLGRGAGFRGWQRAVPACASRLGKEAGWPQPPQAEWLAIDVAGDERGRPCAVTSEGIAQAVEILGRYPSEGCARERAWRVRLASGTEATLVCESKRFWYTDEPPGDPPGRLAQKNKLTARAT